MRLFYVVSQLYLLLAILVVALRYDGAGELLLTVAARALNDLDKLMAVAVLLAPTAVVLPFFVTREELSRRAGQVAWAALGCLVLQIGFSLMKSSIPNLVPFYADGPMAELDRFLHFGSDPWRLAHKAVAPAVAVRLVPLYVQAWFVPAAALPLILALIDSDAGRIRRFVALFLFCWLVLGTAVAVGLSSAGPVFYDRLYGGDRFADLTAALRTSGLNDTIVGSIQAFLWEGYSTARLRFGSGISAFPSVHLAIATVTALYAAERSRWLVPAGAGFVGIILFLSVYTGYHYAIDGYFSVLAVLALWWMLKRRRAGKSARSGLPTT